MKYINNYSTHLQSALVYALVTSVTVLAILLMSFFMAEPQVSRSQDATEDFLVTLTITGDSSFKVPPADIALSDANISGLIGGSASGTSDFSVLSNSSNGYYVDISFADNAGDTSMRGNVSDSEQIKDYASTTEPSYQFTASTTDAQLAYTVYSEDSVADTSFNHDAVSACNSGGNPSDGTLTGSCWIAPTTTTFRIVNSGAPSPTGATTTIKFLVDVPSGMSPALTADTYTATATLSLYSTP